MTEIKNLIQAMVLSIIDDASALQIKEEITDKGTMFEITVGKDDIAKIIGKEGRVASAMRTIAKASGARLGHKVLINVMSKPL